MKNQKFEIGKIYMGRQYGTMLEFFKVIERNEKTVTTKLMGKQYGNLTAKSRIQTDENGNEYISKKSISCFWNPQDLKATKKFDNYSEN